MEEKNHKKFEKKKFEFEKKKLAFSLLFFTLFILIFTIFSSFNTFSLGISPASRTIEITKYDENEKELMYYIINNEDKDMTLKIYAEGEIANYVKIEKNKIDIKKNEEIIPFKIKIDIENLKKSSGKEKYDGKIVVEENLIEEENNAIYAKLKVISRIEIIIPKKEISASLDIKLEEENLKLITILVNNANKTIKDVSLKYEIFELSENENENIINEIEKNIESIKNGEEAKIEITLPINQFKNTDYFLKVIVKYENNIIEIGKKLEINATIDIVKNTKYFMLNEINEFNIEIKNNFAKKINEVYCLINIFDKNKNKIITIKTPSISLNPYEEKILNAYWKVENISEGEYIANITLFYLNRTNTKLSNIFVIKKEKYFIIKNKVLITSILSFCIFIILIALIFILIKNKKIEKEKKGKIEEKEKNL